MKENIEQIIVEFNNVATKIYAVVFKQFSASTRNVDRNSDENVFKMQASKFANGLKYQLEETARKILEIAEAKIHDQLQASLSMWVNYYLQEFQHKCNTV